MKILCFYVSHRFSEFSQVDRQTHKQTHSQVGIPGSREMHSGNSARASESQSDAGIQINIAFCLLVDPVWHIRVLAAAHMCSIHACMCLEKHSCELLTNRRPLCVFWRKTLLEVEHSLTSSRPAMDDKLGIQWKRLPAQKRHLHALWGRQLSITETNRRCTIPSHQFT